MKYKILIKIYFLYIKIITKAINSILNLYIMSIQKATIVFNQTTDEWIITSNENDYWRKIKYLLSKNDKISHDKALLRIDYNESRWRRDDSIILMGLTRNNRKYFNKNKPQITIEEFNEIFDINNEKKQKFNMIYDELIHVAWHPSRFQDWCYDEDDKKEVQEMFV